MVFFSDGYSVEGKFGTNTGASSTPKSKKKYGYKGKKKTAPKETKNYGFNESVDMSSGGDDDRPTAKEKELFRQQEKTYLTKSSGTAGDKYYKNPEGTGTGQGGSGIPVTSSDSSSTPIVTSTVTPTTTPTVTPTVDPVDMSSGGDLENRYASSAASPVSGTGGGQATDIEELPTEPNKLRSALRRRRTKKQGKRGLRIASADTGLNIPAGNSGLGIPT